MRILITVAILAIASSAAADPAAENLYAEGQAAYDRADYATAIAKWQASYALSGESALLFNIAQAYRLSGSCVRAIASYGSYIAADPTADQRNLAEDLVRDLRGRCFKASDASPSPRGAPSANNSTVSTYVDRTDPVPRANDTTRRTARSSSALQVAGLVTGGGGLVMLATGLVLGHHARTLGDEVTTACATGCDWATQKNKDAAGRRAAAIGVALDVVGIAAVAGGAAMYYFGRKSPVILAPTREGATVAWGGSW